MARKPWIVPIPGTTNPMHLRENLGALDFALTEAEVQELDEGFARIGVEGARAPEGFASSHDIGADIGTSSTGGHGRSPLP